MKKYLLCVPAILSCIMMNACGLVYDLYTVNQSEEFAMQEEVTCNLSGSEENQVSKVMLKGELINSGNAFITNLYNRNVLHTNVVGRFGCPVEIIADETLFEQENQIIFYYHPDNMNQVPAENLILLHYNEETATYDTIPSELDTELHTVSAMISETGTYMLADAYLWYGVWGMDVSEFAHDTVYRDSEFCFELTIPKEIQIQPVGDYLKDDEAGKCRTLLECKKNNTMQIGIEYLERPDYASAVAFMDELAGGLHENGYLQNTGKITSNSITTGYYFYAKFDEQSYSISCVYPMSATNYINIWYGFQDESYYQQAMQSLESFLFYDIPKLPESP